MTETHAVTETRVPPPVALPTVIVTSVIRSTSQGQSHGGVYLIDLTTGTSELVLDWHTSDIDWEGRGGDRGLRGITFHDDCVYLAASDEILMYDPSFNRVGSFTNPYLKHCHEIDVDGDSLYVTSTGFDSVLRYDLSAHRFVDGFLVRYQGLQRAWQKALRKTGSSRLADLVPPKPTLRWFDPNQPDGPAAFDTCHLNSVTASAGHVFVAGRKLPWLYEIVDGRLSTYATVALETHNTRPFRDGVLMNDTDADAVRYATRDGDTHLSVPIASYPDAELKNLHLAAGRARQAFGRGLTVHADR
jgi:hypothetical protein